ncbi:hypothetical protein CABS01_12584 [Colletotrichum abscissum]|uniref:uncharacterized protein n=1 Tax=Colletotrichum abscissum TaxID=1671311 RepID=UPI0027D51AA3|nr:uncharacterized protein CABS01_12584 [Colletotrichum abscissum]KAK1490003.1 hypothetical protein CABS01_12584 [Colletotrichum abscissum]
MSETLGLCSWMIGSVISGLLDPHSTEACPSGVLLEMSLRSPTEELACTVPTERVQSSSTPLTPSSEVLLTSRLNLPILDGVWEDNVCSLQFDAVNVSEQLLPGYAVHDASRSHLGQIGDEQVYSVRVEERKSLDIPKRGTKRRWRRAQSGRTRHQLND